MNWLSKMKKVVSPRLPYGWSGDYQSWEQAAALCDGYSKEEILERCKASLLKVKNGEAVYERDSVLFDEVQYSWPLLAGLLKAALCNKGNLCVLDFGGSLGSSYFQNRNYLSGCNQLTWCIVEQPHFVECGRSHFADEFLFFFDRIETCIASKNVNVLLLSGVLQYLPDPFKWIENFTSYQFPYILVDCMPFNKEKRNRLTIQRVHPSTYEASYPCWFLNYQMVLDAFLKNYHIVSDHDNIFEIELDNMKYRYKGFLLKHNE